MARDRSRATERGRGRGDDARASQDRIRIAQTAARLIAEHGLVDWSLAKRKAARQLMLPDTSAYPSNDEIEAALVVHHELFGGEAHRAALRAKRTEALAWMKRLAIWEPLLVGGVAAGWATAHSDARLELVADDLKTVAMALAGAGVAYVVVPQRDNGDGGGRSAELFIATSRTGVRLSILSPQQRRNRPRHDDEVRLAPDAVIALLSAD